MVTCAEKKYNAYPVGKWSLSGGKRSLFGGIGGCNKDVTHASSSADDFRVGRVFFNFRPQAVDIFLEKFRGSSVMRSPDTAE
jgi:hypothetical protein